MSGPSGSPSPVPGAAVANKTNDVVLWHVQSIERFPNRRAVVWASVSEVLAHSAPLEVPAEVAIGPIKAGGAGRNAASGHIALVKPRAHNEGEA